MKAEGRMAWRGLKSARRVARAEGGGPESGRSEEIALVVVGEVHGRGGRVLDMARSWPSGEMGVREANHEGWSKWRKV